MTDKDNLDARQRFTGAYLPVDARGQARTADSPVKPEALGDNGATPHNRQDTTMVSTATGQKSTFARGDVIDNTYELIELLGRGGMGIVFSCRHRSMDKEYAIKLLSDDQLTSASWTRFQSEAKALARLKHPGIVGIHNMGIHNGVYPYYVMDLLHGETLDVKIANSGKLPVRQALNVFIQVTDALHSAHQQGIIHRDIKPSNLMLEHDPISRVLRVKLMDFGIARLTQQGQDNQSQTATGLIFGTPYYMSPEQCQGNRADQRSDIYSLGCTFFESLTGRPPFCGESAFHTFMMHQTKTAPTLANVAPDGNFTDALETVVATMLKKDPADRYPSMLQVQHDLERVKLDKPVREQGLVGITSGGENVSDKRFDPGSSVVTIFKILCCLSLLILAAWAIYTFAILPPMKRAKFESDLAKERAAVQAFNKLSQTLHTSTTKLKKTVKGRAELDDERDGYNKDPRSSYLKFVTPEDLVNHGISAEEFDETIKFSYKELGEEKKIFAAHLKPQIASRLASHKLFRQLAPKPGFQFFDNVSIGGIKVDDKKPVLASGFVAATKNAAVTLYLETATCETKLLELIGPEDITAVEIVWPFYRPALEKFQSWTRLKKLSMFNSLIKAPLLAEQLDESPITDQDLNTIDQMSKLTSLGLCGRNITVNGIFNMKILQNLDTLKFKSVGHIDEILNKLAPLNNLKEVWLINEGLTDAQLKPLTKLKNLATLRIMRSPLTTDSYKTFAQMPSLKTLNLSTSWAPDEQDSFRANLPHLHITFERSSDLSFWVLVTKGPRNFSQMSDDNPDKHL